MCYLAPEDRKYYPFSPLNIPGIEEIYWNSGEKKKKVYDLWKKWQATQEGYKDAVRLRREEVRRTKGWLELNLDATVKDNKNVFVST